MLDASAIETYQHGLRYLRSHSNLNVRDTAGHLLGSAITIGTAMRLLESTLNSDVKRVLGRVIDDKEFLLLVSRILDDPSSISSEDPTAAFQIDRRLRRDLLDICPLAPSSAPELPEPPKDINSAHAFASWLERVSHLNTIDFAGEMHLALQAIEYATNDLAKIGSAEYHQALRSVIDDHEFWALSKGVHLRMRSDGSHQITDDEVLRMFFAERRLREKLSAAKALR